MGNNKLLASTLDSVYYSDDNGETWATVTTTPTSPPLGMVYCGNGVVVGVDSAGNIWKSTDYGDEWADTTENIGGGSTENVCLEYLGNGKLLAGSCATNNDGSRGLWSSSDYGDNWSQLGSFDFNIFSLLYLGDGVVLAGIKTTGVIKRSDDYGATWTDKGDAGTDSCYSMVEVREGEIIACGSKRIRSTDNGLTWADDDTDFYHVMCNMGGGWVLGGVQTGNGGIFKSSDYGATWAEVDNYGYIWALCFIGDGKALAGECAAGDPGIIYKTDIW